MVPAPYNFCSQIVRECTPFNASSPTVELLQLSGGSKITPKLVLEIIVIAVGIEGGGGVSGARQSVTL